RGADQSYCVLITPYEISSDTRKRMEIMTESNDGFVIAEADLKLRGPGDLEGTQQSGIPFDLRIADLVKDNNILYRAREIAEGLIEKDPRLEHPEHLILKQQLARLGGNRYEWGRIS
ncbi:MAG: ATP-dependent DNA helicase RecG, partial [Proteiniphilum sp.]